jgi:hypothetical protein
MLPLSASKESLFGGPEPFLRTLARENPSLTWYHNNGLGYFRLVPLLLNRLFQIVSLGFEIFDAMGLQTKIDRSPIHGIPAES